MNTDCIIKIVDIGANPIDGEPPYAPLLASEHAQIIGFEPNLAALDTLNKRKGPMETYLPHAIGDGKEHTLHMCLGSGMTSLLEPDPAILPLFHMLAELGVVVRKETIETTRLDDIPETQGLDFLKIDIQGAELMVFQHAIDRLQGAVLIHTEVEFLPLYKKQPLFSDVDQFLRKHGYILHRFDPLYERTIKPVDPFEGKHQMVWADAVYIRDFTKLDTFTTDQLLRLAIILHTCYSAFDVTLHLLAEYDRRKGTHYNQTYWQAASANA